MPKTTNIPQKQIPEKAKSVLTGALNNPVSSMRALVKQDLHKFIQCFWETYSQDPYVDNWHIKYICKELEIAAKRAGTGKKKLHDIVINVPPGSTKTAIVSIFFPVWCWVNWFHLRFITTSHSSTLSLESAEYSRDIIRSEKFKTLFPEIDIKQDKDTKSNFRVVKKEYVYPGYAPRIQHGGGRVSTSVDAKIIGFHGHIIIADDLIDPKRALSPVGLETANNYMDQTLSTRKVDKELTVTILIMQRLHQKDPTGHLLDKKKENVKHISIPGEIRNYPDQVKPPELKQFYKNDLLDPKRLSWTALKDLEANLGQYGYAGQVGQDPSPPGGGMFQVDKLQIIERLPSPVNFVATIRYWDKAGSQGQGAYTAGVKISKLVNGRFIVSDVVRGQWSTNNREDKIKRTAEADRMIADAFRLEPMIYIEQEPGSGGKESAENTVVNLAGYSIHKDRPTGDKIFRADPFSVQVNNGNVMLLRGDWNQEFINELRYFPFGTYKDQVDAASAGFAKLTNKKRARSL